MNPIKQDVTDAQGNVTSFLRAGAGAPVVLFHGIGGGAQSWASQLQVCGDNQHLLAWDAPGYGISTPISNADTGSAMVYGERFWAWLDVLHINEPIHLVGQSLGCIMAAAACALQPTRVSQLTLLAPALGYGKSAHAIRESKRSERINKVETLGMALIAEKRAAAMLAPNASAEKIQSVREIMAAIPKAGYIAATNLLAESDLKSLLENVAIPITVAAGRSDTITPYTQCKDFAAEMKCLFVTLGDAGHASATDEPALVSALLASPASLLTHLPESARHTL